MSGIGFHAGQRVRFSSLAAPWHVQAGTVAAPPDGRGPSRRDDQRVFVLWDGGGKPKWSDQDALVDEELYLHFERRSTGELPWLGYAGPVQRWTLTRELRQR